MLNVNGNPDVNTDSSACGVWYGAPGPDGNPVGEIHNSASDLTGIELRVFLRAGLAAVRTMRGLPRHPAASAGSGRAPTAFRVWGTGIPAEGQVIHGLAAVASALGVTSHAVGKARSRVTAHADVGEMFDIPAGLPVCRVRRGMFVEEAVYQDFLKE